MIQSNTTLDIIVNGQRVDILDRSSINLRINNVVYNPTEIKSTQAEYSFSFNLPTTPNNNKIFNYANELSKVNKFKTTYNCDVYVDGVSIFTGQLIIQSIKKGFYNVNLVNIKINTVSEIFGDMTLNELDWKIPFNGAGSINTYNADANSKVIFPLVSYGVFQKSPASSTSDYNTYTGKFQLDKYNKWYYESFNPSPNLLEVVKRLFKQKGYSLQGDIFQDEVISNLYMSMNLGDDQIPNYNLGEPNLGSAVITTEFSNYVNKNTGASRYANFLEHNLGFPYQRVSIRDDTNYNFPSVDIYDLWSETNSKITRQDQHYLFDDFSNCIVIPADGLYKIKITADVSIPAQSITATEYWVPSIRDTELEEHDVQLNNSLKDDMPIEIQLVKNNNECELIHGSTQWSFTNGDRSKGYTWNTAYPHEELYSSSNPTVYNASYTSGGTSSRRQTTFTGTRPRPSSTGRVSRPISSSTSSSSFQGNRGSMGSFKGYMPKEGELLAYDPWVNGDFVMGLSTLSGGTPAIIKNGYSWNKSVADKYQSKYDDKGYWSLTSSGRGSSFKMEWKETDFNKNTLIDSPANHCSLTDRAMTGTVSGIVYLNRNDVLMLKALSRHWSHNGNGVYYDFDANVTVEISAYSPYQIDTMDYQNRGWNSPTQFDIDLSIGQFLNKTTKVSDFIDNFIKEFNLSFINEGKTVYLNRQQLNINDPKYSINIDDRVSSVDAESQLIEYPSSMEVKYKIDTEEWGFETTVPADKLNDPNWKDYGDYGSDVIIINDRDDQKGESVSLSTSYCWYDDFKILNDSDEEIGTITIPVISKFSYMIDGYSYEDSMKEDGKGLPLRYWFKGKNTGFQVKINGKYPVYIYDTTNQYKGISLSYHNKDKTLLPRYFNLNPDLSGNYISINCFLNAYEYSLLKNGANVIFDSDVYIVSEIQGYDAMGLNQTELLLIKKG